MAKANSSVWCWGRDISPSRRFQKFLPQRTKRDRFRSDSNLVINTFLEEFMLVTDKHNSLTCFLVVSLLTLFNRISCTISEEMSFIA